MLKAPAESFIGHDSPTMMGDETFEEFQRRTQPAPVEATAGSENRTPHESNVSPSHPAASAADLSPTRPPVATDDTDTPDSSASRLLDELGLPDEYEGE